MSAGLWVSTRQFWLCCLPACLCAACVNDLPEHAYLACHASCKSAEAPCTLHRNEPRYFYNSSDDPCAKNPDQCTKNLQASYEEVVCVHERVTHLCTL